MRKLVLLAMAVALFAFVSPAYASTIRVECKVYAVNREDPIAFADHLHRQIGNTSTTDASTYDSLFAHPDTSCETGGKWWTNAGWFPVERYESVPSAIIYYRAPGDQTQIADIPNGLQLLATKAQYNCGGSPDNPQPFQNVPVYSCTTNWGTHVRFPRCWNGFGLEETATIYGPNRQDCPASNPVKLPEINFEIRHPNTDGKVPNPLQVSSGVDEWSDYTSMHADYFFAAQPQFNEDVDLDGDGTIEHTDGGYSERALIDLCLRNAPDALEFNNERCRAGGLLDSQRRALANYYSE